MINLVCSEINVIVLPPKKWSFLHPKLYVEYKYSDHIHKIFISFEHAVWSDRSRFQIIRKFTFAVVKMFVNQIWENIGIEFDNFGGRVTRLTTFFFLNPGNFRYLLLSSLSEWKIWIKIPIFKLRYWCVSRTIQCERMCVFLGKIITVVRYC